MLPTFKEVVEELFEAGLVRAVFATETLALGINMPARTVVIERLDKWNGDTHARADAGGVHAADRPGRAAGNRRGGPRGGAVAPGHGRRGGGRAGRHPDLPAQVELPALLQHGGEPGRPGRPGARGRAARVLVRPVPGRPGGGGHRPAGPAQPAGAGGAGGELRPRRLRRVRAAPQGAVGTGGGGRPAAVGGPAGRGAAVPAGPAPGRRHPRSRWQAAGYRGRPRPGTGRAGTGQREGSQRAAGTGAGPRPRCRARRTVARCRSCSPPTAR